MSRSAATPEQRALIAQCLDRGVPFSWRGPGTLVIAQAGLADLLSAVEASGVAVIGLDGFDVDGGNLHPRLDLIYDRAQQAHVEPADVVSKWPEDVWVEVTIRSLGG